MRLFCKLSSSGSSDPYHFGGTRSVLSWETIVHYPRYKLRGQIRLKDTTLSLGSGQHYHLFVFCTTASDLFISVSGFLTNTRTTLLRRSSFFWFCSNQFFYVERTLLFVTIFRFCSNFLFFFFSVPVRCCTALEF